jgi:hypothetical protein
MTLVVGAAAIWTKPPPSDDARSHRALVGEVLGFVRQFNSSN